MRLHRLTAFAPLLAGLALAGGVIVLLQTVTTASPRTATSQAAGTPEEVVAAFVQSGGSQFAGDCEQTQSPRDIGKTCLRFIEEQGSVRAYLIGRTFSEFSTWVFVQRAANGWTLRGSAPLDFLDTTGTIPWPQ